ncbi:MAG: hypothetical protein R3E32_10005 [Chitinophagales bacterium]
MKTSKFFGILLFAFFSFFLQSNAAFAQRTISKSTTTNARISNKIDLSKVLVCKPNSFYAPYVTFAQKSPNYNVMAVNVTLVSLWNHFTGQAAGRLTYNASTCSFVGTIDFRFSDRLYAFPNCNNSGGIYFPQYPFDPNRLDKAQISINATTGVVSLQLWGSKTFDTTVTKGIINGFEKSANMMIAITSKQEEIPIIK